MTTAAAVDIFEVILVIHILAVVVSLGVIFVWPMIFAMMTRAEPRSLAALYRMERIVEQRLVSPGLVVVLACGIYLASKLEVWSTFYVQWGLGAVIVLGGILGGVMGPTEKRLADLSEQEALAAGEQPLTFSAEHRALAKRLRIASTVASLIVVATVYFMATQTT